MQFRKLSDFGASDLNGKRIFIRADFNVPLDDNGKITDDTRIRAAQPGMKYAIESGARVMVTSHLKRPTKNQNKPEDSLDPVAACLSRHLGQTVRLIGDWVAGDFTVSPGEVVLLENCRCNVGEKANDAELSRKMAALCDIYVNDACAGPLMAAELEALTKALASPKRPLIAIVAGSKVSTKLTILNALADKVDQLIVGGGIANTFLMARGVAIGKSLAEPGLVDAARDSLAKLEARGAAVPLPTDVICAKNFAADAKATCKPVGEVADDDMILDIGPESALALANSLKAAGAGGGGGPGGGGGGGAGAGGARGRA